LSPGVGAEVERLALLLRCERRELEFLSRFAAVEIRELRVAAFNRLYADHEATYARIATASRLLPMKVTAPLAERMLPPRVSAGVVASLPPDQAATMAGRMSVDYVADVSSYLSPSLAGPVLGRLPVELVQRVAGVLCDRADYSTMAEVVGALSDEQVVAVVESIDETEILVQVALRVTDPDALGRLARLLPDDRLHDMVRFAGRRTRMWPDLMGLLNRLPSDQRRRLVSGVRAG
jgi:hypothetical protein